MKTPCPVDPDNFWIDEETGQRVNASTGERLPAFADGEVVGLDGGCVVQWDAIGMTTYTAGETPEEFGLNLMEPHELARIKEVKP